MVSKRSLIIGDVIYPLSGEDPRPISTTEPTNPSIYSLVFSTSNKRTSPQPLTGASVSGSIAVFTTPNTDVTSVTLQLDSQPSRTESSPPFDLLGGDASNDAIMLDTFGLANGNHTVTAQINHTTGTAALSATFSVANTPQTVPGAATGLTVVGGSGTASASWTAPANLGNPAATQAYLEWFVGGVSRGVQTISATTSTSSVTSTTATYVTVQYFNVAGTGTKVTSNTVTPSTPPGPTQQPATENYPLPGLHCGVPTGTVLTARGSLTSSITQTITNQDISGTVSVTAGTLTLRRCRIRSGSQSVPIVGVSSGATVILEDCEMDGMKASNRGVPSGSGVFIVTRCWIHDIGEGPRLRSGCIVQDSRIENLVLVPEPFVSTREFNHDDGLQSYQGINWKVLRCHINANRVASAWGPAGFGNACLMFETTTGSELAWCYLDGGGYMINGHDQTPTNQIKFHDNTFGDDARWGYRRAPVKGTTMYDSATGYGWHPTSNIGAPGKRYAGEPVPNGQAW